MTRKLTQLLTRFKRPRRSAGPPARGDDAVGRMQLSAIRYLVAQEAVNEAELAIHSGDDRAAEQAIERARSIDHSHPRLIELAAWLDWRGGRADHALRVFDTLHHPTPRERLLRLILQCQAGQRHQAYLDLHGWSRQTNCPAAARVLLALLQLEEGRTDIARQTLIENTNQRFDANTGILLGMLDLLEDRPDAMRQTVGQLSLWFGDHHRVTNWLADMSLDQQATEAEPALELIEQLAGELLRQPELITTLVVGQRCQPNPSRIELLRRALARTVNDLSDAQPALEALAELSEMAGDDQMARLWAIRGLKSHPYSARLAMMIDRLDGRNRVPDEQVIAALQAVLRSHKHYPDIRRALIRRYDRAGLNELARRKAKHWLQREPDHPLARQTVEELAA